MSAVLDDEGSCRVVYLTFDDGPDPDWTPRILDLLFAARMQATFFAIGEHAQREPALLRRIVAEGHAVGNHTHHHRHPWLMTPSAARAEVRDGAAVLSDVLGVQPRLFRPPHGRERACMIDEAEQQGEAVVLWDKSAVDWGPVGTAARIAKRLAAVQANDIVLLHDGQRRHNRPDQLLQVLPAFLRDLERRGLHSHSLPMQ